MDVPCFTISSVPQLKQDWNSKQIESVFLCFDDRHHYQSMGIGSMRIIAFQQLQIVSGWAMVERLCYNSGPALCYLLPSSNRPHFAILAFPAPRDHPGLPVRRFTYRVGPLRQKSPSFFQLTSYICCRTANEIRTLTRRLVFNHMLPMCWPKRWKCQASTRMSLLILPTKISLASGVWLSVSLPFHPT